MSKPATNPWLVANKIVSEITELFVALGDMMMDDSVRDNDAAVGKIQDLRNKLKDCHVDSRAIVESIAPQKHIKQEDWEPKMSSTYTSDLQKLAAKFASELDDESEFDTEHDKCTVALKIAEKLSERIQKLYNGTDDDQAAEMFAKADAALDTVKMYLGYARKSVSPTEFPPAVAPNQELE